MREKWGVHIWFDSGGFFVQQGKIRYEDLFARLLAFTEPMIGRLLTSCPITCPPRRTVQRRSRIACE
jgi:hypothetical protein